MTQNSLTSCEAINPLALSAQIPLSRARCLARMVKKKPSTTNYTYKAWTQKIESGKSLEIG